MKSAQLILYPAATICLFLTASAQSRPFDSLIQAFHALTDQTPLGRPSQNIMSPADESVSTGVIISDVIGKTQSIAIFSSLTRDIDSVSERFHDAKQNATVLAPQNGAMKNLKRKPWEDAEDYQTFGMDAYGGSEGEDRAHRNLRRFVESHIIPQSPWQEGQKVKTMSGKEIWWESKDGKKKVRVRGRCGGVPGLRDPQIQPYDVEVVSIADRVANGEVWVLASALFLDPASTLLLTYLLYAAIHHNTRTPITQTSTTMSFKTSDLAICITCGTQYDAPLSSPPKQCRICEDPRQYVPPYGQLWTSLSSAQPHMQNTLTPCSTNPAITFLTTTANPSSPSLHPSLSSGKPISASLLPGLPAQKVLGIGQRAILLQTPNGNILWDCLSFLSPSTVSEIQEKGGLKAIVISHPHFWTTHLEWAKAFECPVYLAGWDEEWSCRADNEARRVLVRDEVTEIVPGVKVVRVGGHFEGSMCLWWDGRGKDGESGLAPPESNQQPGTSRYTFMWSYPNMIPLAPAAIHKIWNALKPLEFTATYGGFMGQDHRAKDIKAQILESMKLFVKRAGHEDVAILKEGL
ncbi:hypothetical protein M011DRAFT_395519 [Sporormia fimetaria CBS 119925]|uniref:FAS1 domain-containing protein n=1 Tax=Sporormia fimetaria CBS 119925 TaxID=1340428 RepID=A0A6A6VN53_9PLEO|nr:hypothetical protein M011DRAFT_395519 [Sporormia fimetaria CBS 119925]